MATPNKNRETGDEIVLSDDSDDEIGSTDEMLGPSSEDEDDSSTASSSGSSSAHSVSESSDPLSSSDSEQSDCLSDVWSDDGISKSGSPTLEAQEAQLRNDFNETILEMHKHPVVAKYHVHFIGDFDWTVALEKARLDQIAVNGQLFYAINKNIADLSMKFNEHTYAVSYYLQALTIHPENSELWWRCAVNASKSADWNTALFALSMGERSVRSIRLLAVVQFCTLQYEACIGNLALLLHHESAVDDDSRMLATVIKDEIAVISDSLHKRVAEKFRNNDYGSDWKFVEASDLQRAAIVDNITALRKPYNPESFELKTPFATIVEKVSQKMKIDEFGVCLCDLYDRINEFSILIVQKIRLQFSEGTIEESTITQPKQPVDLNGEVCTDVVECLCDVLDSVCCMEHLICQVAEEKVKQLKQKPDSLKRKMKKRMSAFAIYQRRSTRYIEQGDNTDDEDEDRLLEYLDVSEQLSNRRSSRYELRRYDKTQTSPKDVVTYDPPSPERFEAFLRELYHDASKEYVVKELMERFLVFLTSGNFEIVGFLKDIFLGVYNRWRSIQSANDESACSEMLDFHLAAFELGCEEAYTFCSLGVKEYEDVARFYWVMAKRPHLNVEMQMQYLKNVEDIMDSDAMKDRGRVFSFAPRRHTVSVKAAVAERMEILRKTQLEQLDVFVRNSDYAQIISLLESHFNWSDSDLRDVINNAFILIDCYTKTEQKDKALEWTVRIVRASWKGTLCDVDRVISVLESLEIDADNDECLLHDLANYLYLLRETDKLVRSPIFWIRLYEVTKCREGGITEEVVKAHMKKSDEDEYRSEETMPTRALSVLQYAHAKLGDLKCCAADKGAFLLFYIAELNRIVSTESIRNMFFSRSWPWEKCRSNSDVANTVVEELNQLLVCLFGNITKRKVACDDHHAQCDFETSWKEAELVIPLLFREKLHLFDDKLKVAPESIDLLLKKFAFIWKETCPKTDKEFCRFLEERVMCAWPRVAKEEPARDRIRSTVFYALTLHYYQVNSSKEAHEFARRFLTAAYKGDPAWTASAWAIYAHTYSILLLNETDENLFRNAEKCSFAFKAGFNEKDDVAIMHFEYADTAYQFRTRIARYACSLDRCLARGKALNMLPKLLEDCRNHVDRANELNNAESEPEQDIEWLVCYFNGKVAEKLDEPSEKVLCWYYQCAKVLERQGYQYPLKISKKKQENLEPIELHYRLYAYIWKRLSNFDEIPSLKDMNVLTVYAEHFENHGVTRKYLVSPGADELFENEPDVAIVLGELTHRASLKKTEAMDADIFDIVSDMVERVHLRERCLSLCESNFSLVVSRYPYHYKAHCRIAEMEQRQGHYKKAASLLFQKLFKKRNPYVSVFENCISIQRNDIERSGSYEFHMDRLMELSLFCCFKTNDIEKLCSLLYSLGLASWTPGVLKEQKRKERIAMARKFILTLIERNDGNVLKLTSREKETFWKTAMTFYEKSKVNCDELTRKSFEVIQKKISEAARKHREHVAAKFRQSAATRKAHAPTTTQQTAQNNVAIHLMNYLVGLQNLQQSRVNATALHQMLGNVSGPASGLFSNLLKRPAPPAEGPSSSSSGVPPYKISKQS
ncbi:hypothetical protein QR680_009673 [Steinernema hermaphroditum]|uniref:Uncharacterized protein n=1 Tax=Steinernema hermaphroditum TaxID=289476 RepID=A0AA39IL83_9BILA|nr:hypothetical protein QR680_009673 [Steinernema hermaphroditum]